MWTICSGVGGHFRVLKVSEGTCTGKIFPGLGDHFQVLKVSEGSMLVAMALLTVTSLMLVDGTHMYTNSTKQQAIGNISICIYIYIYTYIYTLKFTLL